MIDYQDIFHTGYLVRDLHAEMGQLSASLGIRWAKPYVYDALNIWTPERGAHQIRLEVAYSADGPQHLEIQTGPPGTVYDPDLHSAHHTGFWVDDVAASVSQMMAQGWKVVVSALAPDQGYGTFAYLRPRREGMLVEVVNRAALPRFERWWGGADGPL